ncbi:MAG: LytTR family transcriptional regulator [Oscillospiraceae bacterium]|nr:LytTR family transcriptional regulator [Oscillospiraceae bacterium]
MPKDIMYIKRSLHYLTYYLLNGEEIRVRQRIADVPETMPEYGFLRSHQRYLANTLHIKTLCAFLDMDLRNRKERTKWIVLTLVYAAMMILLRGASAYEGLLLWIYPCVVFLYLLLFVDNSVIKKCSHRF